MTGYYKSLSGNNTFDFSEVKYPEFIDCGSYLYQPISEHKKEVKPHMENTRARARFLQAMHKFQQNMTVAVKDSKNTYYNSKFSDYPSVVAAFKEASVDTGLSYTHVIKRGPGEPTKHFIKDKQGNTEEFTINPIVVETILSFSDGEECYSVSSELDVDLPPLMSNPSQEKGKAITYNKRYTLQPLLGLPSDDDDGNSLSSATRAGNDFVQRKKDTSVVKSNPKPNKNEPKVETRQRLSEDGRVKTVQSESNGPLEGEPLNSGPSVDKLSVDDNPLGNPEKNTVKDADTTNSSKGSRKLTFNKFKETFSLKAKQYIEEGLTPRQVVDKLKVGVARQGLTLNDGKVIKEIEEYLTQGNEE